MAINPTMDAPELSLMLIYKRVRIIRGILKCYGESFIKFIQYQTKLEKRIMLWILTTSLVCFCKTFIRR